VAVRVAPLAFGRLTYKLRAATNNNLQLPPFSRLTLFHLFYNPKKKLTMAPSSYPEYPPELFDAQRQNLLSTLKDWSIAHGLAVRPAPSFVPSNLDPGLSLATTAPVTLFPSLFPKGCFEESLSIQTTYNKLYSAIASDEKWLKPIIEE
jgi:hypothetical protein